MVANSITLSERTLWGKIFRVCGTHLHHVVMETFDLKVYALHSEGVFYTLHFKKLHPCFNSIDFMMQRLPIKRTKPDKETLEIHC